MYRHPLPEANRSIEYIKEYLGALYHETRLLFKVFRKQGVQDVIHACNPPDLIFIAAAPFFFFTRCRFLFDHHDINPELWIAKFGKKGLGYRSGGTSHVPLRKTCHCDERIVQGNCDAPR